jgi:hypothetical protein
MRFFVSFSATKILYLFSNNLTKGPLSLSKFSIKIFVKENLDKENLDKVSVVTIKVFFYHFFQRIGGKSCKHEKMAPTLKNYENIAVTCLARKRNVTASRSAADMASRSLVSCLSNSGLTFSRSILNVVLSILKIGYGYQYTYPIRRRFTRSTCYRRNVNKDGNGHRVVSKYCPKGAEEL